MTPFKITCPTDGVKIFPDSALGKPLEDGGVQEQEGAKRLIGRELFLRIVLFATQRLKQNQQMNSKKIASFGVKNQKLSKGVI